MAAVVAAISDAQVRAALLYGSVSFLMNFANKAVFAHTSFKSVTSILLLQFLVTIVALRGLRSLGLVSFKPYSMALGRELFFASAMYCLNVAAALSSLSAISIPVYQVIKRLTPVAAVFFSRIVLGKRESHWIHAAIMSIFAGTVVTGFGDLRFDLMAYASGLTSVVSQCLYLIYIQKSGIEHDTLTMMYGNSVNCVVILTLQALVDNEVYEALHHPEILTFNLWAHLGVILLLGVLLNYSLFLCTTCNSALSTTVVGVVKAVFSTALGFFTFGGQPMTPLLFFGVTFNTMGAVWYMYIRFGEKRAREAAAQHAGDDAEGVPLKTLDADEEDPANGKK